MNAIKFIPCQYRINGNRIRICERLNANGSIVWVIMLGEDILNKNGQWEYEPRPSERSDAFIKRTRFKDIVGVKNILAIAGII